MKPLASRDPFKLGLAAIAAVIALALVVVVLSTASFGTKSYSAVLEHTAGLRPGESVEVHGVTVGKVSSVELAGSDVRVDFSIDRDIRVGALSTASVKVATLLGTHYLEVDPAGGGSIDGGTIPKDRTSVPYNLQDVLNEGTGKLEDLDPVLLAKALTAVSDTLGSSKEEIGPALDGVAALSAVVSKRSEQTGELLRAARRVSDQLSGSTGDMVALMKNANLVIREITSRRDAIKRLLSETTILSRAISAVVRDTRADLHPALRDLNAVIATLNSQDKQLQTVLSQVAPSLRYVSNALGNGPWLDLYLDDPAIPADDARCTLGDCR